MWTRISTSGICYMHMVHIHAIRHWCKHLWWAATHDDLINIISCSALQRETHHSVVIFCSVYKGWYCDHAKYAFLVSGKSSNPPHNTTSNMLVNKCAVRCMGNPDCWSHLLRWDLNGRSLSPPATKLSM